MPDLDDILDAIEELEAAQTAYSGLDVTEPLRVLNEIADHLRSE